MKQLILIISLAVLSAAVKAQPYYFRHYQVENGLSNNTVFSSVQDAHGFLWFATKDGLNRFDGYNFKVYQNKQGRQALGSTFIHSIDIDGQGLLWLGTSNGIYSFNSVTETFGFIEGTGGMDIFNLKCDLNGNTWFLDRFSLGKIVTATKKVDRYVRPEFAFDATAICVSPKGAVYIGDIDGLMHRYDARRNSFISSRVLSGENYINGRWISKLYCVDEEKFLIGSVISGFFVHDAATGQTRKLIAQNADKTSLFVRDIMRYNKNEFWIGTESGVYIYNMQTNAVTHLQKEYTDAYSISDNAVYTLIKDNSGGVWAGTYFGGINYYSPQNAAFKKYFPGNTPNTFHGNAVREICEDKYGNLWVGTEDAGLNKLDTKTGTYTHFKPNGNSESIVFTNIHGLLADGDKLWIGTFDHGLDIMDIPTGKVIKHYDANRGEKGLWSNFIVNIHKTKKGQIYVATVGGLFLYDEQRDHFDLVQGMPVVFYCSIGEDDKGNIWLGTIGWGAYSFNPDTRVVKKFKYDADNTSGISHNNINHIFQDKKQRIWIATDGGGLCLYMPQTNTFKKYTTADGFPSNFICRIEQDNAGRLWISTTKGLVAFTPENSEVVTYSKSSGLLSDQFNYNSSFKTTDGMLYFGGMRGMISFNPAVIKKLTTSPKVYITGFQVLNNEITAGEERSPLDRSVAFTRHITLTNDQSSFSLDFAALRFNTPGVVEYAYKMKGIDDNWTYIKTNRKVYFTKLASGKYTFMVKSLLAGGKVESPVTELTITIKPPFYASWWAYLVYALALAGAVYYGFRLYKRRTPSGTSPIIINRQQAADMAGEAKDPLALIMNNLDALTNTGDLEKIHDKIAAIKLQNGDRELDPADLPIGVRPADGDLHLVTNTLANSTGQPHILVISHQKDVRDSITAELSKDHAITLVPNNKDALVLLNQHNVNLVISDSGMHGADGFELCRIIKNDIEFSHIPVVVLIPYHDQQLKLQNRDIEADAYVDKPFTTKQLRTQIAGLLNKRSTVLEHFSRSPLAELKIIAHSKADEKFLEKLNELVMQNLSNSDFNVKHLAEQLNMSRPTLYRKIKSMSDLSPNELISITRLKKAIELLLEGSYKIYEVSDMLGYSSQAYFGKIFQKQFGMSPTDYMSSTKTAVRV